MRTGRDDARGGAGSSVLWGLAPPLIALALWAGLTETELLRHRAVAGPVDTGRALAAGLLEGSLGADLGATLLRVAFGVLLGAAIGLPLGVVTGTSRRLGRALGPGLDFLRAVPPLLLFPLLLLGFGYGDEARVGVIAVAAGLVVSLHVDAGARRGHPERLRALRAMGASRWQTLRWLHLYEVLPACVTALRHAVATGLVVAVVTDMIVGAPRGLGSRAVDAQIAYDAPGLYAVVLLTGLVGFAAAQALLGLERGLVHWRR